MLKFFDSNRKNYLRRLETELNSRNVNQQGQLLKVKKILQNIKYLIIELKTNLF